MGGVEIFGLPLTGESSKPLEDGVARTVQYFERARFELHASGVLIGRLGAIEYEQKYPNGGSGQRRSTDHARNLLFMGK